MVDAGDGFPVNFLVRAPSLVRRRSFMQMGLATLQEVFRNGRAYEAQRLPGEVPTLRAVMDVPARVHCVDETGLDRIGLAFQTSRENLGTQGSPDQTACAEAGEEV